MADESSQEKQLRWFGMAIAVLIIGFGLVVALAGGVLTSVLIVEQFKGAKPGELGLWIFGGGMLVAGVGAIVYGTSLFHRARTDPSVTATKTLPAGEHRALAWVGVVLSSFFLLVMAVIVVTTFTSSRQLDGGAVVYALVLANFLRMSIVYLRKPRAEPAATTPSP